MLSDSEFIAGIYKKLSERQIRDQAFIGSTESVIVLLPELFDLLIFIDLMNDDSFLSLLANE